jgi:hypothetical protein
MRYFLKLSTKDGWYEEVDEYTYKNAPYAMDEGGNDPRYCVGGITTDGVTVDADLRGVPLRDIAIFARALQALEPAKVDGGFIRPMPAIIFKKGRSNFMRTADGKVWKSVA